MYKKMLESLGLTKGEIEVYLAALELGSGSTGPISARSGISRSKLYGIFDKLERKGLSSHVDKGGIRYFQAVEPSKIRDYIHRRQNELKSLEHEFEENLPELQKHYKKHERSEKVTVYQGIEGLKVAYEHALSELGRGDEYLLLGVPRFPHWTGMRYWQKYHTDRAKAGIKTRMLYNRDMPRELLENRNSFRGCDARYMPTDIITPAYVLIYKETATTIAPGDEPICIEVKSKSVADAYRAYFEEYWKKSRPLGKG